MLVPDAQPATTPLADPPAPNPRRERLIVFLEVLLIFAIFFVHGAWPVPDVNEAYYIGKAIHFWNPTWAAGDTFLETADSHWFFFLTFGWLSRFASPVAMAWIGRIVTWSLMAWAWRRMSGAIVPWRWFAPLTAAAFVFLLEYFHLAGEWVIGGVEGKGPAYVLVFLAIESLARQRWNRVWILLGFASAFHVLVGGWSVIACGVVWLLIGHEHRPKVKTMLGGLLLGGLLSLLGLVPALMLSHVAASGDRMTGNTASETSEQQTGEAQKAARAEAKAAQEKIVVQANQIYVFNRLPHHLIPNRMPGGFALRFLVLTLFWWLACRPNHDDFPARTVSLFVFGALLIALGGWLIAWWTQDNRELGASLLRFYWFRLSDFAVPLGVALALPRLMVYAYEDARDAFAESSLPLPPRKWRFRVALVGMVLLLISLVLWAALLWSGIKLSEVCGFAVITLSVLTVVWLFGSMINDLASVSLPIRRYWAGLRLDIAIILLLLMPAGYMAMRAYQRIYPEPPRGEMPGDYYEPWVEACRWVATSGEIPEDARFLTPRMSATFKWHTGRPEVANWKEIPQDARSIVDWWTRMMTIYTVKHLESGRRYMFSAARVHRYRGPEYAAQLARHYDYQYVLAPIYPWLDEHWTRLPLREMYRNERFAVYQVIPLDKVGKSPKKEPPYDLDGATQPPPELTDQPSELINDDTITD